MGFGEDVKRRYRLQEMRDSSSQQLKSLAFCVVLGKVAFKLHDGRTFGPQLLPVLRPARQIPPPFRVHPQAFADPGAQIRPILHHGIRIIPVGPPALGLWAQRLEPPPRRPLVSRDMDSSPGEGLGRL
jgi:hypothetical protein